TRSMKVPERIQIVESALRSTASLYDQGVTPRVVRERVQRKVLVRVARGWFVDGATWAARYPERRHLAGVIAAHRTGAGGPLLRLALRPGRHPARGARARATQGSRSSGTGLVRRRGHLGCLVSRAQTPSRRDRSASKRGGGTAVLTLLSGCASQLAAVELPR